MNMNNLLSSSVLAAGGFVDNVANAGSFLLTIIINGLSVGGIYALIALGYTMVYGIAKMLNFAHGDIIMVGAYAIYVFIAMSNPIVAIICSVIVCVATSSPFM